MRGRGGGFTLVEAVLALALAGFFAAAGAAAAGRIARGAHLRAAVWEVNTDTSSSFEKSITGAT